MSSGGDGAGKTIRPESRSLTGVSFGVTVNAGAIRLRCVRSWIRDAGFSDGLYQMLIFSISPTPPADLWLPASTNHSARTLVSGSTVKIKVSDT